jgi:two-component system chemotaxis response regulator CheY
MIKRRITYSPYIDSIKSKPKSWRLISIEFQDCETLHSKLFSNLCLKNIHSFFDETECKIFWLEPYQILIFFQGRALPIEKCVESFLKEIEFKGFGRYFDILDLSIHWQNFETLLTRILTPQKIDRPAEVTFSNHDNGFKIQLSSDSIKAMSHTRENRAIPLVLLVEDDPFTLQLIKLAFKDKYDVITAETARQALIYYQRHLPDITFLDIQLPDGNGVELLKQMNAADPNSYIVMLSSHSQKERILDCIQKGAKNFIAKPFTRQRLLDATDKYHNLKSLIDTGRNSHAR